MKPTRHVLLLTAFVIAPTSCEPNSPTSYEASFPTMGPSLDEVYNPTCWEQHEIAPGEFEWLQNPSLASCQSLISGFDDRELTFDVRWTEPNYNAFAVVEYRYLTPSAFGVRVVRTAKRQPDDTFDPSSFKMRFVKELVASEMVGYAFDCAGSSLTQITACFWALQTAYHSELRMCIDDTDESTPYANANARCQAEIDDVIPNLNRLPVITNLHKGENLFQRTQSSATWHFSAFTEEPDSDPLTYHWAIYGPSGSIVATSSADDPTFTLYQEGQHTARLRLQDDRGGVDARSTEFTVVFLSSGPFMAEIQGPGYVPPNKTCQWNAVVSNGQSPYQYTWRRNGQVVSIASTYSASTGSLDFALTLSVTDAASSSEMDSLFVDVTSSVQACFSSD